VCLPVCSNRPRQLSFTIIIVIIVIIITTIIIIIITITTIVIVIVIIAATAAAQVGVFERWHLRSELGQGTGGVSNRVALPGSVCNGVRVRASHRHATTTVIQCYSRRRRRRRLDTKRTSITWRSVLPAAHTVGAAQQQRRRRFSEQWNNAKG
jgi:hypothetical protein